MVRQSAGSIVVYSEPGKGTTFRIFLPAVLDSGEGALSSGPEPSYSGTETVLLVEDEDSVREFVALALRQFGYTVLTASGAEAAIQLMTDKGGATDILVTDVVMPEISGRQLAETLQARFAGLKVLFLSGYTDDVVVRHGVLAASAAFLAKPFSSASLARKVRQVLDERRS
jgi:DNA-binding response OmpR family regulator